MHSQKSDCNRSDPFASEGYAVAFLLKCADEKGDSGFTPLQINRLTYICHGWTLASLDRPLIDNSSEQIQAWKYGPVVVGVYHLLKPFGRCKITFARFCSLVSDASWISDAFFSFPFRAHIERKLEQFRADRPEVIEVLDWVYDNYADYSEGQLVNIAQQRGTPWDQCYRRLPGLSLFSRSIPIPDAAIRSYYKKRIAA